MVIADESRRLPAWIPDPARRVFEAVQEDGGYPDPRFAKALRDLYRDPQLRPVWLRVTMVDCPAGSAFWPSLISAIVFGVDVEDRKRTVRTRQRTADKLIAQAGAAASDLANLLDKLKATRAVLPDVAVSAIALIESTMVIESGHQAGDFAKRLSTYQEARFPDPAALIRCLAACLQTYPTTDEVFAGMPGHESNKSTWLDYVRVLWEEMGDLNRRYGTSLDFSNDEWGLLVDALVHPDADRSTLGACLAKLRASAAAQTE